MAGQYELRKFLQRVSNGILKEYFQRIGWAPEVDLDELGETEMIPVFESIRDAPDDKRAQINRDFQQVNAMATEGGIRTIMDEGRFRNLDLGCVLQGVGGFEDQVLRVLLDYPAEDDQPPLFDVARRFNKADHLPGRSWRKRSGVPPVEHAGSMDDEIAAKLEEGRKRLEDSLQSYYRLKEGRGFGCEVRHFERGEKLYWFAYLRDYDSVSLEWGDDGLDRRECKPVFEVIFVHSNTDRSLDIYVKGDKKTVADLQTLWARAVLGTEDLGTPPERGVEYELNILKTKRDFKFRPEDGLKDVRVKSMRLSLIGDRKNRRIRLDANTRRDRNAVFGLLEQTFKLPFDGQDEGAYRADKRLSLDLVNVTQAEFSFVFLADTRTGQETVPVRVSYPNSCSLKHEPKEEIARKYLREYEIDVSQSTQSDLPGV